MHVHEPVFTLDNVRFRFPEDEKNTLQAVSLSIRRGERVVISGPSGSGKSTLLYLLNRLYPLNCDGIVSGSIQLFGKEANAYAPGEINHRIATVFQDPDSQFCMPTVEEELAFTLENLGLAPDIMEKRIRSVLELTELGNLRHAVIQTLSGGMKQRVATACALVMEPEVLLLDEPLSHLDPHTADQFVLWLDELQQKRSLTIVAVEHRLDLWESFFSRELVMDIRGSIVSDRPFEPAQPALYPRRLPAVVPEPVLTASGVSVKAKDCRLLSSVSFEAKRGEVVVIAGPNGSGKSTLLKALCGISPLAEGTIDSKRVGYVPQSPEFLFLETSVEAELAFSGISAKDEVVELMERLRLMEIKDAHPFAVSHGQKRRVAIGAMLADQRQVLLMDEPTSGQDFAALSELHQLIRDRAREGVTFFIVTHDMEFAASIADSVMLMRDGRLSGKFKAADIWANEELLFLHRLLPPKGVASLEESFA